MDKLVKTEKLKSPWNITIHINNGYLEDIDLYFEREILSEDELDAWVSHWLTLHLCACSISDLLLSYEAVRSNSPAAEFRPRQRYVVR